MLVVERRKKKINPRKAIRSELEVGNSLASAKLVDKGVILVEPFEQAVVFSGSDRIVLPRGFYEIKQGPVGVLWCYVEKLPLKVGVRRSETSPHNIGAYADVLAMLRRVDSFAEFLLRKGEISLSTLSRSPKQVSVEPLRREVRLILKRAILELVEGGREITEESLKEAFEKLLTESTSSLDYAPYFAFEVSNVGLSTRCRDIIKEILGGGEA